MLAEHADRRIDFAHHDHHAIDPSLSPGFQARAETSAVTAGGESFVFRYRLLDGCHACAIRGWARIEFDFAPDGTYQRAKVLGVMRSRKR